MCRNNILSGSRQDDGICYSRW